MSGFRPCQESGTRSGIIRPANRWQSAATFQKCSTCEHITSCRGAIKALGRQHADLDLHHVQPTGMLGDIVEFQSAQHPSGLLSRERLVERAGRVGRQIVENDTDTLGLGKVNVSKFAHAGGEIDCGPALGDFHLAPRPMDVDEHEQIGCSITSIFANRTARAGPAWPGSACEPRR